MRGGTTSAQPQEQAEDELCSFQPMLRTWADRYLPNGKEKNLEGKRTLFQFQLNERVSQLMERKGDKPLNLHDNVP